MNRKPNIDFNNVTEEQRAALLLLLEEAREAFGDIADGWDEAAVYQDGEKRELYKGYAAAVRRAVSIVFGEA